MKINLSAIRWVLLMLVVLSFTAASFGQIAVGVSVRVGPPPLPVYAQPICPGPGYLWTPGYWAWDDDDGYYWVPGTWVVAPVGLLWTPGYWGWGGGLYVWHAGYWGPHIGFYGGINYGFGYTGVGFAGGEWRGGAFYYNRSVTNVSVTNVTNVYNRTVVVNENHVAFNGGTGGVNARPTRAEENYAREKHTASVAAQAQHEHAARQNRENFASANHGRPAVAATARPGDFSKHSVVTARAAGGEYRAPAISPKEARAGSTSGNKGNAKASSGNAKGNSNEGFRPFNPPSKSAASNGANRSENTSHWNETRPNQNRPNESRSNATRTNENRPNQNRMNESRPNQTRGNESRPQAPSHAASQPRESAPRQNSHQSSPAPKRENSPPRESPHRGKGR